MLAGSVLAPDVGHGYRAHHKIILLLAERKDEAIRSPPPSATERFTPVRDDGDGSNVGTGPVAPGGRPARKPGWLPSAAKGPSIEGIGVMDDACRAWGGRTAAVFPNVDGLREGRFADGREA
jgi:hypothetical protein